MASLLSGFGSNSFSMISFWIHIHVFGYVFPSKNKTHIEMKRECKVSVDQICGKVVVEKLAMAFPKRLGIAIHHLRSHFIECMYVFFYFYFYFLMYLKESLPANTTNSRFFSVPNTYIHTHTRKHTHTHTQTHTHTHTQINTYI